jgi:hypothetical protein
MEAMRSARAFDSVPVKTNSQTRELPGSTKKRARNKSSYQNI